VSKDKAKNMPIMGHLTELRKRLTWVAIVVVICVIAAFVEWHRVFAVIMYPLHRSFPDMELSTLGVTEGFMSVLKVSIYAGLIVSLPFILYEFWAFVLPGLYENERRSVLPYTAGTSALFLAGVAFGYLIVLPVGIKFMVGYGGGVFNQLLQADRYITFVTMFLLAFGCVFELPLVMMLLAWAGIVDHVKMRKVRKYAILGEAIIAAVFTPSQDPLSMSLMLAPLIVLYEFGIWLAKIAVKRKEKRRRVQALAEAEGLEAQAGSTG
jgi:sec-independent protein translocase protein TatC